MHFCSLHWRNCSGTPSACSDARYMQSVFFRTTVSAPVYSLLCSFPFFCSSSFCLAAAIRRARISRTRPQQQQHEQLFLRMVAVPASSLTMFLPLRSLFHSLASCLQRNFLRPVSTVWGGVCTVWEHLPATHCRHNHCPAAGVPTDYPSAAWHAVPSSYNRGRGHTGRQRGCSPGIRSGWRLRGHI